MENNHGKDLDDYLQIIFQILDFLVEEEYSKEEHNFYIELLKKYFSESYFKFANNPEFLFYIGFIASTGEWYFNIEWKEIESMLKKAACLEPDNLLYRWGYISIPDQRIEVNSEMKYLLSKRIIENDLLTSRIKKKGVLGEYLLEFIQHDNESTGKFLTN
ncbi:MAG: hypothetical protein LBG92_04295 [Prevotellaceae bacterium]|nr:hypothetical protein [Prevotellaceae bacterium]